MTVKRRTAVDSASRQTSLDTEQYAELERLRQMVAGSPISQLSLTCSGELLGWNAAARDLLGWSASEIVGRSAVDTLVAPARQATIEAALRRVAAGRALPDGAVDLDLMHKDGTAKCVAASLWATWVGGERHIHASVVDVTARRRRTERLAEREAMLDRLAENVPGMVYEFVLGADGAMRFVYASPGSQEMFGLSPEQVCDDARRIFDHIHPEDRATLVASVAEAARTFQPWRWEGRTALPGRGERWLQGASRPTAMADGSVRFDGVLLDRTEAKTAEQRVHVQAADLERERVFLRTVLETLSDAVVACDADGRLTMANDAAKRLHDGFDLDVSMPESAERHGLLDTDGLPLRTERIPLVRALAGESVDGQTLLVAAGDRPLRTVVATGRQLLDAVGQPLGAVVSLREITATLAAEEAVARSAEQFRTAFDDAPVAMVIADAAGRFLKVNAAVTTLLGFPAAEMIGKTYVDFTDPDQLQDVSRARSGVAAGAGGVVEFEVRYRHADGHRIWGLIRLASVTSVDGERQLLAHLHDVTARKVAELRAERRASALLTTITAQRAVAAAATESRDAVLRTVAAHAVDAFAAADGAVVELAEQAELVYAATAGDMADHVGVRITVDGSLSGHAMTTGTTVIAADTETDLRVARAACLRLGIRSMCIAPLVLRGAVIGVLKINSSRPDAFDEDDVAQLELLAASLGSALQHAEDYARNAELLSERTQALRALEASEHRFQLAFDNSPLGVTLASLDPDNLGAYLQINTAMTRLTGFTRDQLMGMTYRDLHHPDDLPASEPLVQQMISGELDAAEGERRYLHADGSYRWMSMHCAVVRDDAGVALYLVTQFDDITEQRRAQEQLAQQAALLDLMPAAVVVRNLDGTVRWWSTGAERTYGWSADAVTGRQVEELLGTVRPDGSSAADVLEILRSTGEWSGEVTQQRADGQPLTVLSRQVLQRSADGTPIAVLKVNTDITALRAAQHALAESEQRLRAQFVHSAAGQVIRALDGTWLDVNPAFAAMLGADRADLVGVNIDDRLHPEDLAGSRRNVAALIAGTREAVISEGRLKRFDGTWMDYHSTISAVRDVEGRPKHLIVVITDISARKAAERERDAAALELAARNQELEAANQLKLDLIGMLGHEIGNPLTSILGYTELATDCWDDLADAERRDTVAVVARQAQRLDGIVREVLAMVAADAGQLSAIPDSVDVAELLAEVVSHAPGTPVVSCASGLTAYAQPGHLDQILVNLLSNAHKYGGGATHLTAFAEGRDVVIEVADDGPGVPSAFRDQLFSRFARAGVTAGTVAGTGLGLYIVRELARANGGDVTYVPGESRGSTFSLRLPGVPRYAVA